METRERAWAQVCFAKVLVYGTNQRKRYIQKSSTIDESISLREDADFQECPFPPFSVCPFVCWRELSKNLECLIKEKDMT